MREVGVVWLLAWSSNQVLDLGEVQVDLPVLHLTCCCYYCYRYRCLDCVGREVVPVLLSSSVAMGTLLVWWLSPS